MTERRIALAIVGVFSLALGLRLLPLAWSPYPATLDGIAYAALARDTLSGGHLPFGAMRADNLVFTAFIATTGSVIGVAPLHVAQPSVAFVGAASAVAAMAIVRRFGHDLGFTSERVRVAMVVVGIALAIDGLYLRRTGVPDEEALAFLFLPLLVLALHRGLRSARHAWLAVAGVFLVAFPLTHTFSTLVAGTTLVAWLAAARTEFTAGRLAAAVVVVGAFWGYFAGYYELAAQLGFVVPYVDRVTAHPGLFLAWLLAMGIGIRWFRGADRRAQVAVVLVPVLFGVGMVLLNATRPVFPGTVASPAPLAVLLASYLVPFLIASGAVPRLDSSREGAVLLLALLAAPVTLVGFSLTASLTPEFFGTVMRTQTFAHLPFVALAAVGVAAVASRRGGIPIPRSRTALIGALLVSLAITAPVAYVDLDTLAFPSTTTESEFRGATFAAERVSGDWTSDHVLTRIAGHYYGATGAIGPTATWLAGDQPPRCTMLSATSWTTTGAHFWPAGPQTVAADTYHRTIAARQLVYSSGEGYDRFALTQPNQPSAGC